MKIIIHNRSDKSDAHAVRMVSEVMDDGRISGDGKFYCYVTVFTDKISGKQYAVAARKTSGTTDTFHVINHTHR